VRRADEDAAEDDPERDRRPAELRREDGADDGPRARDGREVVAEEDGGVRGHEVHAVAPRVGRRRHRRIDAELARDQARIKEVAREEARGRDHQQQCTVHIVS